MFKKNMKKGLSVLLSLAMVVTSATVNGKSAAAATSEKVTVALEDIGTQATGATSVGVKGTVAAIEGVEGVDVDTCTAAITLTDEDGTEVTVTDGNAPSIADGKIETALTVDASALENGKTYTVKVEVTDDDSNTAEAETEFAVATYGGWIEGWNKEIPFGKDTVEVEVTINKLGDESAEPNGKVELVSEKFEAATEGELTVVEGTAKFEVKAKEGTAGLESENVQIKFTDDKGVSSTFLAGSIKNCAKEGIIVEYAGNETSDWGDATNYTDVITKLDEDAEVSFTVDIKAPHSCDYLDIKPANAIGLKETESGVASGVGNYDFTNLKDAITDIVVKTSVDGEEWTTVTPQESFGVIFPDDCKWKGIRINLMNEYNDAATNYFADKIPAGKLQISFKVKVADLNDPIKNGYDAEMTQEKLDEIKAAYNASKNPTPENPVEGGTTTADAATVTAVTMTEPANKNVVVTASSAAVTAAAVLKLDGTELGLVAAKDVTVVTTAAGVKVDVSTKAAVATKGATTATFAAVITVPANAATGVYPVNVKVATKGATATFASVGTLTINAATAAVVEEPPVVDVPGKATKSIKLAVNKATIGVKEKINVKVTTKKTAAATAAKKVTISKNSKKAVATAKISGKKLVITGKKAGKTVITVKSGKKTAKITVTVKKAPKKVSLKDGKKAAKKTVSLSAKTKKKAVSKTYTIVLPKNTASYGYTVKKSGKKAIIKKVAFKQSKAGVTNKVVVTVKKGAKGSAKVVLVSKANKKAKATIKVKATK